ncbi:hypothetical protein [Polyangium mundeleinium]|uniref:Uncharacterized protein n=1 Tax=Polyangium mundeleinium TaxID=2995306 RepID=A0ABT5EZS2_9BACT|nr:hypothetical protein [Polyangium mundeleinium]MDC0746412.1 hypothetical protein [Polyangium mundeleinium]
MHDVDRARALGQLAEGPALERERRWDCVRLDVDVRAAWGLGKMAAFPSMQLATWSAGVEISSPMVTSPPPVSRATRAPCPFRGEGI